MRVSVIGAGVAGLACALALAERGARVEVFERAERIGSQSCSWYAGGMLAPWCERERAEPLVQQLGQESLGWWTTRFPGTICRGSLVVAPGRDIAELTRFAQRTTDFNILDESQIAALEPDLSGRFNTALHFKNEAHLDPRAALQFLAQSLLDLGGRIRYGFNGHSSALPSGPVVDCTGMAARTELTGLRGVKGEMLILRSSEITLQRAVRVLHPRVPVYIVPRDEGLFMVGATMIESEDARRITARSMLELLGAAYALHPAFADAEIVETGTQLRPAFTDNLPRLSWRGETLCVNGLYRHGFLLAPALATRVAGAILDGNHYPEVMREDLRKRQPA
jgi:glycine oxidase